MVESSLKDFNILKVFSDLPITVYGLMVFLLLRLIPQTGGDQLITKSLPWLIHFDGGMDRLLGRKECVPGTDAIGAQDIFPYYFPFLSEPAAFFLTFSLAAGADEWG